MADYNVRGNKVANAIYDLLLKPSPQDEASKGAMPPIPEKPAGIDELPNINMSAAPIKNLSELKTKTPQEQYEDNVQKKNPASAYTRKEKEDLKNIIEIAKEAGVLEDDADLASQTPAGEASAEGILPGSNGWVNQTGSGSDNNTDNSNSSSSDNNTDNSNSSSSDNNTDNSNSSSSDNNTDNSNSSSSDNKTKEQAKQESRYKLRSIMDAYNEGILDKESRDYLIMDTLSKFVRNMGKDISNIAAAYTGGTINNEREESIWSKRNEEMAKKAINAEGNKLRNEDNYDLNYQSQKLELAKKRIQMVPAQNFQKAANEMRKAGNETGAAIMDLIAAASTQDVGPEEYIATAYANDPNVKNLIDNSMGALSNVAGSLGDLTGMVKDFIKELRDKYGNNSGNNSANKSTSRRIADAAFGGNPLYNAVTNYMDKK